MIRLAIFASHGGSILQAVIDACNAGELNCQVVLVLSNNSRCKALQRAKAATIPTIHLSSSTHPNEDSLDQAMLQACRNANVDWILLGGYMKRLGPQTLTAFNHRIINAHPALLPKFGGQGFFGAKVHQAVLNAGEKETGATVHFVVGDYDTGPILSQVRVPVRVDDNVQTLETRVKQAERKLIVQTLKELSHHRKAS